MEPLTFDQALERLGLELSASDEEVRRAYLRLLRGANPERDPAGFMALRAAYELVRAELASRRSAAASEEAERLEQRDSGQVAEPPRALAQLRAAEERIASGALVDGLALARDALELEQRATLEAAGDAELVRQTTIDLILSLLLEDRCEEARELVARFDAALAVTGGELRVLDRPRLILVRELALVAAALPARIRRAVATGLRSGDLDEAIVAEIQNHAVEHLRQVTRLLDEIQESAPTLASVLREVVRPLAPHDRRFGTAHVGGAIVLLLLAPLYFILRPDPAPPRAIDNSPPPGRTLEDDALSLCDYARMRTRTLSPSAARLCTTAHSLRRATRASSNAPCAALIELEAAVAELEPWPVPLGAGPAVTRATLEEQLAAALRPCRRRTPDMESPPP